MDPHKPFKIVKVPTAYGICQGLRGEIVDEYEDEAAAQAMCYEAWLEDKSLTKGIIYKLEVIKYPPIQ